MLELCAGTLEQFINGKYKGLELPPDEIVLYQIACGVAYIHSKNLVHRDIKPENILLSLTDTDPVMIKVSDFGLSKSVNSRGSFSVSGIRGTFDWMAPEFLAMDSSDEEENEQRGSVKSDVFCTGLVFFYFVKRGIHPFGKGKRIITENILNNKPVNFIGKKIQLIEHTKVFSNKERTCKLQLEYFKLGK